MSFFDTYGTPSEIKPDKKLETREMLEKNIADQEKLLNGEDVKNAKGETIRSWFRDGRFVPTISIFGLFGGKALPFKKGGESKMLADFKKAFNNGDFDSYISEVDKKRQENIKKLSVARVSKDKKKKS